MKGLVLLILLAALVVLAIFSGVFSGNKTAVQQIETATEKIDLSLIETDVKVLTLAIESFYTDHGRYPIQIDELTSLYLRGGKIDPWGTSYTLALEDEDNLFIVSAGKDKILDTPDDIRRRLK